MPRLIDADRIVYSWIIDNDGEEHDGVTLQSIIDKLPTVDAVEVVRCKDCKNYIPCQKLPIGTSKWCDLFDRATCEMNYCGWGERGEDADK